jgi:adenosylcobinamide-GDP ribazoletransferase
MLEGIKFCISFLTRFPIKRKITDFDKVAHKIYLFPLIGFIIGLIVSFIYLLLSIFLTSLLISIISIGLLIYLTGAHHLDGLLDFGDGLMATGSYQEKIEVMHDASIGTGGFSLGFVVLISTIFSINAFHTYIIAAITISEITAKFSMVLICSFSKSVKTPMATKFIELNTLRHALFSFLLAIPLIFISLYLQNFFFYDFYELSLNDIYFLLLEILIGKTIFKFIPIILLTLISAFISTILIKYLSYHNFKGVTGDCIGALHEITRLITLISLFIFFNYFY